MEAGFDEYINERNLEEKCVIFPNYLVMYLYLQNRFLYDHS